ncbi:MAG TPA: TetR family transcriptional regulator [Candidatus Saccharimonadales bacterium]|nr:TetR family transcriptional regulator [Candidatus Saccharimonadales bacterium]
MSRQETETGLNREAVIQAALGMLDAVGVEGLSMRALADRLGVKAASLYWHIRDKEQLLELVAEAVLERVAVPASSLGWRPQVTAACDDLAQFLKVHQGAATVVLGSLPVVQRSRLTRDLAQVLGTAGLAEAEAAATTLVVEAAVSAFTEPPAGARGRGGQLMTLAIDSGSWRVLVRAAASDTVDVATSTGGGGAASVEMRPGSLVLVKNRRGGDHGAVELSPNYTWHFKIHGGTWNTVLDLSGLRVSGIELDSGAGNVTCTLPAPVGVVPIRVNSGIVGVTLHRPRNTAVHAAISQGSVKVRLDDTPMRLKSDVQWDTPGAMQATDRYDLAVYSGCVRVTLDAAAPAAVGAAPSAVSGTAGASTWRADQGISLVLDGIEKRLGDRGAG